MEKKKKIVQNIEKMLERYMEISRNEIIRSIKNSITMTSKPLISLKSKFAYHNYYLIIKPHPTFRNIN